MNAAAGPRIVRAAIVVMTLLLAVSAEASPQDGDGAKPAAPPAADDKLTAAQRAELAEADRMQATLVDLFTRGRYSESLPLALRVREIRERVLGPSHDLTIQAIMDVAAQLAQLRRNAEAEKELANAMRLVEAKHGRDTVEILWIVFCLGQSREAAGDWPGALREYERALKLAEKAEGTESIAVAQILAQVARSLEWVGRTDDGIAALERCVALYEKFGERNMDRVTAWAMTNLGRLRLIYDRPLEAEPLLRRALAIRVRVQGRDHPETVLTLEQLSLATLDADRPEDARLLFEETMAAARANPGADPDQLRRLERHYGKALARSGRVAEGVAHCRAVVAATLSNPRAKPQDVAVAMLTLGCVLVESTQFDEAATVVREVVRRLEAILPADDPELQRAYTILSNILSQMGLTDEALPLAERAFIALRAKCGDSSPRTQNASTHLWQILWAVGRHADARTKMQLSVEIQTRIHGADSASVLYERMLQVSYLHDDDPRGGAKEMAEIVAKTERLPSIAPWRAAQFRLSLAGAQLMAGQHADALASLDLATPLIDAAYGTESTLMSTALKHRVVALVGLKRRDEAQRAHNEVSTRMERELRRSFLGLTPAQRRRSNADARSYLDLWVATAPSIGITGYDDVLRLKGLVARFTAAERAVARQAHGDALPRVQALREAERTVARLANSVPMGKAERAAWQESFAKAAADCESKSIALSNELAGLRASLDRIAAGLPAIRAEIGPGEALVDYLCLRGRYVAFIVRRDGDVKRIDLGTAAPIDEAAQAFARACANPATKPDGKEWLAAGRRLADLVFARIERELGADVKSLTICPDAALAAVPFAALPSTRGGSAIDRYALRMLATAQDLLPSTAPQSVGAGALLIGDVDYRAGAAEKPSGKTPPAPAGSVASRGSARTFAALPGTAAEIDAIARTLGSDALKLVGAAPTEAALRAAAPGRRILHIATHGFVRDDLMAGLRRSATDTRWLGSESERTVAAGYDPMLLAGLAMTGAQTGKGGGTDDGVLSAIEAAQLDLTSAELVVLSACSTALGKAESGEGVVGLVQGFQMAGARSVIASLWPVDDQAARILMEAFYADIAAGKAPSVALRSAALKVRGSKDAAGRPLSSPTHWAAFVSYGR